MKCENELRLWSFSIGILREPVDSTYRTQLVTAFLLVASIISRWPFRAWWCFAGLLARIRANGPTGNSTWAVQLSLQRPSQDAFPSESCCIDIFADIVTNKKNTLVLRSLGETAEADLQLAPKRRESEDTRLSSSHRRLRRFSALEETDSNRNDAGSVCWLFCALHWVAG
jgi:hypothetical protein